MVYWTLNMFGRNCKRHKSLWTDLFFLISTKKTKARIHSFGLIGIRNYDLIGPGSHAPPLMC